MLGVKREAQPASFSLDAVIFDQGLLRKIADLDHALEIFVIEQRPQLSGIAASDHSGRVSVDSSSVVLPDALPCTPGSAADQQQHTECDLSRCGLHRLPFPSRSFITSNALPNVPFPTASTTSSSRPLVTLNSALHVPSVLLPTVMG